jgi:hypothetical protein
VRLFNVAVGRVVLKQRQRGAAHPPGYARRSLRLLQALSNLNVESKRESAQMGWSSLRPFG